MDKKLNKMSFRKIKINLLHKVNIKKTSISLSLGIKKPFFLKKTSKIKPNNKLNFRIIKTKIFHNFSNQFLIIKIKNYFLILQKALLKNMKPIHMLSSPKKNYGIIKQLKLTETIISPSAIPQAPCLQNLSKISKIS